MMRNKSREPAIAVVGHLVKDEIVSHDGRMRQSLGGIAYSLAALGAILKKGRVTPVCTVGFDIEQMVRDSFCLGPKFDLDGMRFTGRPNVVNRLVYNSDGTREEWNSKIAPPLDINGLDRRLDAVLLNFISGRDVRLPDLKAFRARYRGIIYCDYHSLSLGHDKNLRRYHRLHPRYRDYIGAADIVQMNMAELASINHMPLFDTTAVARACGRLHEAGAKVAIITAGSSGVMLSAPHVSLPVGTTRFRGRSCSMRTDSKTGRKSRVSKESSLNDLTTRFYHVPAVRIRREVDPTGCGDTLGAAFLYNYLLTGNLIRSLEIGNLYAAAKATFSGLDGFAKLEKIVGLVGPPAKAVVLTCPRGRSQ